MSETNRVDLVATAVQAPGSLNDLIRKSFIEPIRSVLIVDDQYPTWDMIFSDGHKGRPDGWNTDERMRRVIRQFRGNRTPLTIDIHDGSEDESVADYLHQSDLLVLDFELNELGEAVGQKATRIISRLLSGSHFNLIVVHTADGVTAPFYKVLQSLMSPIDDEKYLGGEATLNDAIESTDVSSDLADDLVSAVDMTSHVGFRNALRNGETAAAEFIKSDKRAAKFHDLTREIEWDDASRIAAFVWAMQPQQAKFRKDLEPVKNLSWSEDDSAQPWIRAAGGFVAFADKKSEPDILKCLEEALVGWKPSPSRMISSRIRAEISSEGVAAEDGILIDRHAYWKFYQELLQAREADKNNNGSERVRTLLEAHTQRHVERLFDIVGSRVVEFGREILNLDSDLTKDSQTAFSKHYGSISDERKALNHYNSYISTKPVSGWHLQPGHILKVGSEYWACVSPSCDLVPAQKSELGIREAKSSAAKPFLAIKLHKGAIRDAAEVNSNTLLFLEHDGELTPFSIYTKFEKDGRTIYGSAPIWRMFSARDYGKFALKSGVSPTLRVNFVCGSGQKGLQIQEKTATIVGQLRYEYALNLVQKLGSELTRVGLDFVAPVDPDNSADEVAVPTMAANAPDAPANAAIPPETANYE